LFFVVCISGFGSLRVIIFLSFCYLFFVLRFSAGPRGERIMALGRRALVPTPSQKRCNNGNGQGTWEMGGVSMITIFHSFRIKVTHKPVFSFFSLSCVSRMGEFNPRWRAIISVILNHIYKDDFF